MSVITIPRVFGGTLILGVAPPIVTHPGLATIADSLHGTTTINDQEIQQASITDVSHGAATIADTDD